MWNLFSRRRDVIGVADGTGVIVCVYCECGREVRVSHLSLPIEGDGMSAGTGGPQNPAQSRGGGE